VFLTDPGAWGGGPRRAGFVVRLTSPTKSRPSACQRTRNHGRILERCRFRRELRRSHQGEEQFQSNLWLTGHLSLQWCRRHIERASPIRRSSAVRTASSATTRWPCGTTISGRRSTRRRSERQLRRSRQQRQNTWEVNEKLTTAYVKVGINSQLGSLPLRGNIGVQASRRINRRCCISPTREYLPAPRTCRSPSSRKARSTPMYCPA
jgi:hypothetical protein